MRLFHHIYAGHLMKTTEAKTNKNDRKHSKKLKNATGDLMYSLVDFLLSKS